MDPTAPKDNDQNPPDAPSGGQTPIQPGGFVVSGEQTAQPVPSLDPQQVEPPTQKPFDSPPQSVSPQPASDLREDIQSTVAAATGTSLAGQNAPSTMTQDNTNLTPTNDTNQSPLANQPDPTPFVPPGQPPGVGIPTATQTPPVSPPVQQPQQGDSTNSAKFKSIIIIVAVFILVAILAAVAWYFILNRSSTSEETTTTDTSPIELPPSPSPKSGSGFGNLPEPTPEASEESILEEETVLDQTTLP